MPLRGQTAMFERISLEAFQSGLSWLIILRKRPGFRAAFAGFDPATVAGFGDADRERLLADAGIVRNRLKIDATIANARAVLDLDTPLDELLWSFAPAVHRRPATLAEVPATSPESVAMAKSLKKRGFRFVGPTTCYALMQATGIVDDHVADCWRAGDVEGCGWTHRVKETPVAPVIAPVLRRVRTMRKDVVASITAAPHSPRKRGDPLARRHRLDEDDGGGRMAAMKPRTGDGPLEVTKEGRGIVMRVPLEGGGRLVVEMSAEEASDLGEALKAAVG